MQRPVPDPEQPDINGVRALRPQAVPRGNHVVANGPAPTVHVYGDDLSAIIGFDLLPDVPLIYLVAEAGRLFAGAAGGGGMATSFPCVMAGVSASLIRPPFKGTTLQVTSYNLGLFLATKKPAYIDGRSGYYRLTLVASPRQLVPSARPSVRPSVPRRPALPPAPVPQSAPTRTGTRLRAGPCGCGPWASRAPRP